MTETQAGILIFLVGCLAVVLILGFATMETVLEKILAELRKDGA